MGNCRDGGEACRHVYYPKYCQKNINRLPGSKSVIQHQKRYISLAFQAYQRYFTKDHEWIDVKDGLGTVGITNHAQAQLGELVYVELPDIDDEVESGDPAGVVESVKAASDVMTPVTGVVTAINEELQASPSLINQSAEEEGWMFTIKMSDSSELDDMMDHDQYLKFVEENE